MYCIEYICMIICDNCNPISSWAIHFINAVEPLCKRRRLHLPAAKTHQAALVDCTCMGKVHTSLWIPVGIYLGNTRTSPSPSTIDEKCTPMCACVCLFMHMCVCLCVTVCVCVCMRVHSNFVRCSGSWDQPEYDFTLDWPLAALRQRLIYKYERRLAQQHQKPNDSREVRTRNARWPKATINNKKQHK